MNKEKAYKRLIQRQLHKSTSDPHFDMMAATQHNTGRLAVVEIKEKTVPPTLRRAHTVAEFNSWRHNKTYLHDSKGNSKSVAPEQQFPPILNGRTAPNSANYRERGHQRAHRDLRRSASLPGETARREALNKEALVTSRLVTTRSAHGQYRTEGFELRPARISSGSFSSTQHRLNNSPIDELAAANNVTYSAGYIEVKGNEGPPSKRTGQTDGGKNDQGTFNIYRTLPRTNIAFSGKETKTVTFNDRPNVSFIDSYVVEYDSDVPRVTRSESPLALTEKNLGLLQSLQCEKKPVEDPDSPVDTRVMKWLEERQIDSSPVVVRPRKPRTDSVECAIQEETKEQLANESMNINGNDERKGNASKDKDNNNYLNDDDNEVFS